MLETFTVEYIFQFFLIFCRIGGMIYFIPALGDKRILMSHKIGLIFVITICSLGFVSKLLPQYTTSPALLSYYIASETMIGAIIGFSVRLFFSSLFVVGNLISMQAGLSAATMFDPTQKEQVMLFSNLLSSFAVMFIFASDSYHLFIAGIIDSYSYFQAGKFPLISDITEQIIELMSASFTLSLQISAPFIIIGMSIMVGSGVLSRLMPNFQVFFVVTPAQILVLFCVLYIVINNILESVIVKMISVFNY